MYMKQIFFCLLLIFISNCKNSTNEAVYNTSKKSEIIFKKDTKKQIDFLDIKYQKNGFSVPDDLNGDLYPSYSYFDKSIGVFSVNYIGKDNNTRYYWNINNPKGYFSNKNNFSENSANNSSAIKQATNNSDYYTFVDYIPAKYIKYIGGEDEEFNIINGAITSFYLYENFKWVKIGEIETKKIPERTFQYYIDIINSHIKRKLKIAVGMESII